MVERWVYVNFEGCEDQFLLDNAAQETAAAPETETEQQKEILVKLLSSNSCSKDIAAVPTEELDINDDNEPAPENYQMLQMHHSCWHGAGKVLIDRN